MRLRRFNSQSCHPPQRKIVPDTKTSTRNSLSTTCKNLCGESNLQPWESIRNQIGTLKVATLPQRTNPLTLAPYCEASGSAEPIQPGAAKRSLYLLFFSCACQTLWESLNFRVKVPSSGPSRFPAARVFFFSNKLINYIYNRVPHPSDLERCRRKCWDFRTNYTHFPH